MDIKTIKVRQGLSLKLPTRELASSTLIDLSCDTNILETLAIFTDHQKLITPLVKKDDCVKKYTPLFTLKEDDKVKFLSPISGKILDFLLDGRKRIGLIITPDHTSDTTTFPFSPSSSTSESVKESLLESGLWTLFRQRPFSKIPHSSTTPSSICITAMDTDPLPRDIPFIISQYDRSYYSSGIQLISKLCSNLFFCTNKSTFEKISPLLDFTSEKIRLFEGRYPNCLPGTHIHYLDPVYNKKEKLPWYIDIEDLIRIGKFFTTKELDYSKTISLSGDLPSPTHIKILPGTSIDTLINSKLIPSSISKDDIIIGSYLNGKTLDQTRPSTSYIGIYDTKISILTNDSSSSLFGWARPEPRYYSFYNTVISKFIKKKFKFSSKAHGSLRPVFPLESFDKVFPFETSTLFLLKSLLIKDIDMSVKLGCLELGEEDLGLCSFICPSKHDWGSILQVVLQEIEKEESIL